MFIYRDTQKFSDTFRPIEGELKFVKFIVTYLHCTKYSEIKYFIQLYKNMFQIQNHTNNFWYKLWVILLNGWICILNYVSLFVSILIVKTDTPFVWWKKYCKMFPILSRLAKKFLCAPISTIYSERVFSEIGNIYNNKKNSLSPENVEKLVFLHHNLLYNRFDY